MAYSKTVSNPNMNKSTSEAMADHFTKHHAGRHKMMAKELRQSNPMPNSMTFQKPK